MFPLRDDNPTSTTPFVNHALVAVNVAVFVYQAFLTYDVSPEASHAFVQKLAVTPSLLLSPAVWSQMPIPAPLTMLTSMFVHAGLMPGLGGTVFVHIALRREEQSDLAAFEAAIQKVPEIMECYLMTGEFDYLLRLVVSDMADFERLHNDALTRLPGVARVNSSVAIRTVRKTTVLPVQ